jgi:hypothetical protein
MALVATVVLHVAFAQSSFKVTEDVFMIGSEPEPIRRYSCTGGSCNDSDRAARILMSRQYLYYQGTVHKPNWVQVITLIPMYYSR